MKKIMLTLLIMPILGLLNSNDSFGQGTVAIEPVDQLRVGEVMAMLPENAKGFGDVIQDRKIWDKLAKSGRFTKLLADADKVSSEPFPAITDEVYLSFFTSNDSQTSKNIINQRSTRLAILVWAECLTNNGKYLPAIENALHELINQKSWNFPGDDRKKTNFEGKIYTIGLGPAAYAFVIGQSLYLLGDKIKATLRTRAKEALYQKAFNPTLQAIKTCNANKEFEALTKTNNYNSVCLAGITGAALAIIAHKEERAIYVTIAERYAQNSIAGFLSDGYCTEGLSYFNYGFSHYIQLRESLLQATRGKVDLFKDPKVKKVALFANGLEMMNGVYPAIGDCSPEARPEGNMMFYISRNLNLGLKAYEKYADGPAYGSLSNLMYHFPNATTNTTAVNADSQKNGIRTYFDAAGVLVVRPDDQKFNMAAAFKGGNNNEHHNHNDLGSFTILVGNEVLVGDPGIALYTSKTFSAERYTAFKTMASYGHPVPLISGIQQSVGKEAEAKIIRTEFSDSTDVLVMDITSAYKVPALKEMQRTFSYNRGANGYLEIKDEFTFLNEQQFETALITTGKWRQLSANALEISGKKEKMTVVISAPGNGFTVIPEIINEAKDPYMRLAIRLKDKLKDGAITMTFKTLK